MNLNTNFKLDCFISDTKPTKAQKQEFRELELLFPVTETEQEKEKCVIQ
jgi:hypothetical protein